MIDIGVSVSGSLNMPDSREIAGAIRRGMTKIAFTVANQATQNADGRPGPSVRVETRLVGDQFANSLHAAPDCRCHLSPIG